MAFLRAAKREEIPEGAIHEVWLGQHAIALANVGGRFYALDNTCLHRGGPLGKGHMEGSVVTCPWHGWTYEVTTGQVTFNPTMAVRTYPVEERGDEVWVDVA